MAAAACSVGRSSASDCPARLIASLLLAAALTLCVGVRSADAQEAGWEGTITETLVENTSSSRGTSSRTQKQTWTFGSGSTHLTFDVHWVTKTHSPCGELTETWTTHLSGTEDAAGDEFPPPTFTTLDSPPRLAVYPGGGTFWTTVQDEYDTCTYGQLGYSKTHRSEQRPYQYAPSSGAYPLNEARTAARGSNTRSCGEGCTVEGTGDLRMQTHTLTITPSGPYGMVAFMGGPCLYRALTCVSERAQGEVVQLEVIDTFTPIYQFDRADWGGACSGVSPVCAVTMDADKTVAVSWKFVPPKSDTSSRPGGKIVAKTKVPGPGTLTASAETAKGTSSTVAAVAPVLAKRSKKVTKASVVKVELVLRPTTAGKRLLGRKRSSRVIVKFTFAPKAGKRIEWKTKAVFRR